MRACLVSGRVEVSGDERADRDRGLDLPVVRAAERVEALDLDFDLDFVMGSSEVMRRHPPHHLSPARAKPRQGNTPKHALATSKSPQQCSDRTRKPVKSEQDNCSFGRNHRLHTAGSNCIPLRRSLVYRSAEQAERLALSGDPVDQTCGIQQRCCLIEELLDVESDFETLLMKARPGAGIGCAPYSRGLIKPATDLG
jgi:hypothetical protein